MDCAEHWGQSRRFATRYREWLNTGAPSPSPKPPLIWIEANACSGDTIALMNTQDPNLAQVLERYIDVRFYNGLLPAEGGQALRSLFETAQAAEGRFYLFVEGAIPLAGDGLYTVVVRQGQVQYTAERLVRFLGARARYVVAAGTCACYGGPSAARPNLSGSVGVRDVLNRQVINVSGCPTNPDWLVGTLYHLLYVGMPTLDEEGRPLLFYEHTVHRNCQRRSYFDGGVFAEELGDIECMFQLGCVGPRTPADCPYRQWNDHVNWPVKAGTPCIGCTTVGFPDRSMPFFKPLPEKEPRRLPSPSVYSQGGRSRW